MIDGDDFDFALLVFNPTTLPGFIAWILVLAVIGFFWFSNTKECEGRACPDNQVAKLLDGECVCVGVTQPQ